MARQLLCGTSALEDSDNRRRYLYILDVEWEQAVSNSELSSSLCSVKISNHAACFGAFLFFLFFSYVFPPKQKWCWFCTCTLRLAACLGGERKSWNVHPHFSHSFACYLIGLLHLLRATNCLLGILHLKHSIKHTNASGTVFLELPCQGLKSSLCICACDRDEWS